MRVSHIILRVVDMSNAVRFYRDAVGLSVVMENPTFSFLDAGSVRIGLNETPDHEAKETTTEVVLEVDDIAATFAAMRDRGVPFQVAPRAIMADGTRSMLAAHFRDADGHLWPVTGWVEGTASPGEAASG